MSEVSFSLSSGLPLSEVCTKDKPWISYCYGCIIALDMITSLHLHSTLSFWFNWFFSCSSPSFFPAQRSPSSPTSLPLLFLPWHSSLSSSFVSSFPFLPFHWYLIFFITHFSTPPFLLLLNSSFLPSLALILYLVFSLFLLVHSSLPPFRQPILPFPFDPSFFTLFLYLPILNSFSFPSFPHFLQILLFASLLTSPFSSLGSSVPSSAVRQRTRRHPLPWSSSLRLRYERERLELQKTVTEQLVSDVFGFV